MTRNQFSSGDVIADRRADYARMLMEAGDHAAAAELWSRRWNWRPAGRRAGFAWARPLKRQG